MIHIKPFDYPPEEHEAEKASGSYLMSLVALVVGLPLPIVNLISTWGYYLGNRRKGLFVRWHCMQALLSQVSLTIIDGIGFWWTISIVFGDRTVTNNFIAYIITILLFNLLEFVATVYTAIQTRKGIHVEWWFYGSLTNQLVKQSNG